MLFSFQVLHLHEFKKKKKKTWHREKWNLHKPPFQGLSVFSLRGCTLNNAARWCQLSVSAVFMSYRGARSYLQSTQAISPLPFHLFHIINKQKDPGVIAKKLKTHFQNQKKGRLVRMLTRVGGGEHLRKKIFSFPEFFSRRRVSSPGVTLTFTRDCGEIRKKLKTCLYLYEPVCSVLSWPQARDVGLSRVSPTIPSGRRWMNTQWLSFRAYVQGQLHYLCTGASRE